jgi:D-threo-aldose 1-dehydrogenase
MIAWQMLGRGPVRVTRLGFGGGPIGWDATPEAAERAAATLSAAWEAGIRFYDTAPFYGHGQGERRLGTFLAGRPRDGFVLSSKVGRLIVDGRPVYDYSRDGTLRSVEESLARLGLDRIDLLLVHDIDSYTHGADQPARMREALAGALPVLADLKAQGVIRGYGLGVNEWRVCADVAAEMPLDAILLAGRYTLLEQGARGFLDEAERRGIGIILGGPYNSGILATGAREGALYDYRPAPPEVLARVTAIAAVLDRRGVPLPAASLQYPLRHPAVATVIPGLLGPDQVAQTRALFLHRIPEAVWSDLAAAGLIASEQGERP